MQVGYRFIQTYQYPFIKLFEIKSYIFGRKKELTYGNLASLSLDVSIFIVVWKLNFVVVDKS